MALSNVLLLTRSRAKTSLPLFTRSIELKNCGKSIVQDNTILRNLKNVNVIGLCALIHLVWIR